MKLNKIPVFSIIFVSLLFCFSNSSAAPGKHFNQTDTKKIKKIRAQILKQLPGLKEIIKQEKKEGLLFGAVSVRKEREKFNVNSFKEKLKKNTGNIKVIINSSKDINALSDELKTFDVRVIKVWNNTAAIEAPVDNLEKIFREIESIEYARLPLRFFPMAVESEGVAVSDSDDFHNLAFYGAGVKIAVMDVGFKGLTDAQQDGDLPANAVTYDFTGNGIDTEYYHGTACAEVAYDLAPQAEFHLLKISTSIDILEAIDYCIDNSIDIISLSIGTFGTGPGDGTGFLDEAFDEARDNGILVVAAAGNNGNTTIDNGTDLITLGAHWKGAFRDNNDDDYHEFLAGNTEIDFNIFAAYPTTNDDGDPEDSEVSVLLRWNDWIDIDIDYDLILYEYDSVTDDLEEVASSTYPQNGSQSQEPVEYISLDIPDNEDYLHYYAVAVVKYGGVQDAEMEIHLGGTSMFLPYDENTDVIATSSSSITEPADAESVLAVGAIDYTNWVTGPQEDFSSQGPTNAWAGSSARIKPDVMGPDGVTTFTYGAASFFGVSAATPHVAGLAALVLSKYPDMTPDELQDAIESNAVDMGLSGKDNIYGWGRLKAETDLSVVIPSPVTGGVGGGGGGGGCFIGTAAFSVPY